MDRRKFIQVAAPATITGAAAGFGSGWLAGTSQVSDEPSSSEFELVQMEAPKAITQGTSVPINVEIENVGNEPGKFHGTLVMFPKETGDLHLVSQFALQIKPGETKSHNARHRPHAPEEFVYLIQQFGTMVVVEVLS